MECNTKYPIMLVHGTGFRDRKFLNYWGRVPAALEKQGATLFYGHQDSWGSVEHNAEVLKDNLNIILADADFKKVNIIAHSKGGVEVRYMISSLGMADKIASLTTIATPHHGSETVDLFIKLPKWLYKTAAFFTNMWTNFKGVLHGTTRRGISHADVIDARRMNLSKKKSDTGINDIRDFYIDVVAGLKQMGL